jgi:multidrug efflux system outer membrane protein
LIDMKGPAISNKIPNKQAGGHGLPEGFGFLTVTIGLVLFALSGCTMIPQYARPGTPVPADWPSGPAYMQGKDLPTDTSAVSIKWREFFVGGQLQKLIALALDNNRDLRIAALNIERSQALYQIQRADLFPTVAATGSGLIQRIPASLSTTG